MQSTFNQYLGDGINFDFDGNRVILTGETGRVYLKPKQVETLKSALIKLRKQLSLSGK